MKAAESAEIQPIQYDHYDVEGKVCTYILMMSLLLYQVGHAITWDVLHTRFLPQIWHLCRLYQWYPCSYSSTWVLAPNDTGHGSFCRPKSCPSNVFYAILYCRKVFAMGQRREMPPLRGVWGSPLISYSLCLTQAPRLAVPNWSFVRVRTKLET